VGEEGEKEVSTEGEGPPPSPAAPPEAPPEAAAAAAAAADEREAWVCAG